MENQKKLQRRKTRFITQMINYQGVEEQQSANKEALNRPSRQMDGISSLNSHQEIDLNHSETEDNKTQVSSNVVAQEKTHSTSNGISQQHNEKGKIEKNVREVVTAENKQQDVLKTENIEISNINDNTPTIRSIISTEQQEYTINSRQFNFNQTLSFFKNLEQLAKISQDSRILKAVKNSVAREETKRPESSKEEIQSSQSEVSKSNEPPLTSENSMSMIQSDNSRMFSYNIVRAFWERKVPNK